MIHTTDPAVVITKVAALSPFGSGFSALQRGLKAGQSRDGRLPSFDPKSILGEKGLRYFDRNTLMILSCLQVDLADEIRSFDPDDVALVVGTMFGGLSSQLEFSQLYLAQGFKALNAMNFPNMVLNTAPSQANSWFNLGHSSTTITNAFTAGLDAVCYGADLIKRRIATAVIAGGSDEYSPQFAAAMARRNWVTSHGEVRPFDQARDGTQLGEGTAFVLLQDRDTAVQRGEKILAEIVGYAATYQMPVQAMQIALDMAQIAPTQISFIAASANGTVDGDAAEKRALQDVFGEALNTIPMVAYNGYWGECGGGGSAMRLAAAISDLCDGRVSTTPGYRSSDETPLKMGAVEQGYATDTVLINAFGLLGHCVSLVLRKVLPG